MEHQKWKRTRVFWVLFVAALCLAPTAKSDTFTLSFISGANPGDGGTITTNGCVSCSDADITAFDFTIFGFEFTPPDSFVSVSGIPGTLLGNTSIHFLQSTGPDAPFPDVTLFESFAWEYRATVGDVETPTRGEFSLVSDHVPVPEPSSLTLILMALLTLGFTAGRRCRA